MPDTPDDAKPTLSYAGPVGRRTIAVFPAEGDAQLAALALESLAVDAEVRGNPTHDRDAVRWFHLRVDRSDVGRATRLLQMTPAADYLVDDEDDDGQQDNVDISDGGLAIPEALHDPVAPSPSRAAYSAHVEHVPPPTTAPEVLSYGTLGLPRLVTVARAGSEFEAGLICGKLKATGIQAYAPNNSAGALHPAMRGGGFPVQVEQADEADAIAALADTPVARGATPPPAPVVNPSQCAACRHTRRVRARHWQVNVAVAMAVAGGALLFVGSQAGMAVLAAAPILAIFQGPLRCGACRRPWGNETESDED